MRIIIKEFLKEEFLKTLDSVSIPDMFDVEEIMDYINSKFKPDEVFNTEKLLEWYKNYSGGRKDAI